MNPERWTQIADLCKEALTYEAEARVRFLDQRCGADADLRREVESLIEVYEAAPEYLETPVMDLEGVADAVEDALHIGPYRLVRLLGQGGMGEVYLALRTDTNQHVALKLLRTGRIDFLQRFEAERQILASLNHPQIARLLDVGQASDGRPYFVMEYVDGLPITDYCDQHRLPIEDRLALFAQVCEAVQYAHRNLVVHRDLKPSNILVTHAGTTPSEGRVKLLDFGIAKVLETGPSVVETQTGLRVMTPAYASPEQVLGKSITTSSDVYSLGVLLFELLTGRRPYALGEKLEAEVVRIIAEEEPVRPSTAVTQAVETQQADGTTRTVDASEVSAARQSTAERLQRVLRGELDNIVLKALRKESERRYGTAQDLAGDVDRYLRGLPVSAQPDTMGYRVRKFVRRHRWEVGVATLGVLLLLAFSSITAWQAKRVAEERDRAQAEAAKAQEIKTFLLSLFESADPTREARDSLLVREVLDDGAARIENELAGQPEVQGEAMGAVAQAYYSLGRSEDAVRLQRHALDRLQAVLPVDDPAVQNARYGLAGMLIELAKYTEAEALFREYLRYELSGGTSNEALSALFQIGNMQHVQGNAQAADSAFTLWSTRFAATPHAADPTLAKNMRDMVFILTYKGELEEAEAMHHPTMAMERQLFGDRDVRIGEALVSYHEILTRQQRHAEAEPVAREVLTLFRELHPEGHTRVALALRHLGKTLSVLEQYEEGERFLLEGLAMEKKLHGEGAFTSGSHYRELGRHYARAGDYAQAEGYARAAVALFEKHFGPTFAMTRLNRGFLASVLTHQGRYPEAEALLLADYKDLVASGKTSGSTAQTHRKHLVALYEAWGRPEEAAKYGG